MACWFCDGKGRSLKPEEEFTDPGDRGIRLYINMFGTLSLDFGWEMFGDYYSNGGVYQINYCPVCGRRLGDLSDGQDGD